MSHIRSVPSIEAGNAASHAIGLGQMNLHGYLAREGIAYGSPEALDFTNLYFYTITWHALRTSMLLARERGETFAGFKQSRYASGEYFSQYLQSNWQPKTAKVGELFARSGITLPTREMWAQLRDDVMRYGIYNQNLQAVPPTRFYLLYQPCHVEYSSDCGESRDTQRGQNRARLLPCPVYD